MSRIVEHDYRPWTNIEMDDPAATNPDPSSASSAGLLNSNDTRRDVGRSPRRMETARTGLGERVRRRPVARDDGERTIRELATEILQDPEQTDWGIEPLPSPPVNEL